jgi:hypothetical protein
VKDKRKEYLKTYRKLKIECGCGGGYLMKHKGQHEGTKIHINNLEEKEKNDLEKWENIVFIEYPYGNGKRFLV